MNELPFLTREIPPIGGVIKRRCEDFLVEEVPLYEPSGTGTHTYFYLEKTGLATMRAVRDIARALNVNVRDIGYAGLKDANAVTRQLCSIEHVDPAVVQALSLPRIRILWVSRHGNKLRLGHLKGNRFVIRLRDVDVTRLGDVRAAMELLSRRGVPNYFGPQRFGARGDTWRIGRALLRRDWVEAVAQWLGRPDQRDQGDVLRARRLYDAGDYAAAAEAWPQPFRDERRACRALAKTKGSSRRAVFGMDANLKRLFISAYQSYLFNHVLARRIDSLDRLMAGDLAWRHDNGAVFHVPDPAVEQPRCDAFEISPTGPLFGYRMTEPTGQPLEIESAVLAEEHLTRDDFRVPGVHRIKGGRRPLRFRPDEWEARTGSDDLGPFIELRFFLPPGCYATALLRELCKSDTIAAQADGA